MFWFYLFTENVGKIRAGDLQQKNVNGRTEVGVDDLGDVAGHNLREIGQTSAGDRLDGRDGDLVFTERAAQHAEEMTDILAFYMQYQYRTDKERYNFPDRYQHVSKVARQSHLLLYSTKRFDEACERKVENWEDKYSKPDLITWCIISK